MKTEFKGTKGDWVIGKDIPNGLDELKGNIQILSSCSLKWDIACVFTDVNFNKNDKIAESNAKLISCAPEMLQLLEYFLEQNMLSVAGEELAEQLIIKATTI
jgi:hypothetical protein